VVRVAQGNDPAQVAGDASVRREVAGYLMRPIARRCFSTLPTKRTQRRLPPGFWASQPVTSAGFLFGCHVGGGGRKLNTPAEGSAAFASLTTNIQGAWEGAR
jgi:hypothetical protein